MLESARDLTIEAAVSASTRLSETPTAKRPQEISKLLNSRADREVLNGMKCVIAMISRDEDGTPYFADVVKNVTLDNSRVRALVLIYLQKYAENEPDTALLSINLIQKSLSGKKPNARAASIRTLGGIRIPEIASLLVLCIKRTVSDSLPQVRAAAALAVGKAYSIDGINRSHLSQHLATLLSDRSPVVVAAAIKVFYKLKPQLVKALPKKAWAPLHSNFRRYTRILHELDEWSTSFMVDILAEYSRRFLPRPMLRLRDNTQIELPDLLSSFPESYTCEMDSDLELFVNSLASLSHSSSDVIVISSVKALAAVATPDHVSTFGFPKVLVKIATQPHNLPSKLYALQVALKLALVAPQLFENTYRKFFLFPQDSLEVSTVKLRILLAIISESSAKAIFQELQYNALCQNSAIAQIAVRVIDVCSQKNARWSNKVLKWCLYNLENPSARSIVGELLTVIRHLLQERVTSGFENEPLVKTIYKLSLLLHDTNVFLPSDAKASIIWIIGEFTEASQNLIGPDVLRRSLRLFASEPDKVRYEILVLAAKSYLFELKAANGNLEGVNQHLNQIFKHIMHLCHYDSSFDTRDRVRMWEQLLTNSLNHQLAALFLEVPKPTPVVPVEDSTVHSALASYFVPIPWSDQTDLPPKSIRKSTEEAAPVTHVENGIGSKQAVLPNMHSISSELVQRGIPVPMKSTRQLQSLDEFFANDDESEEESELESSSEEESEEDEEEDEEEDDSDEESEVDSVEYPQDSASRSNSENSRKHPAYDSDDALSTHSNQKFI